MQTIDILKALRETPGLHHPITIPPQIKHEISIREETRNTGVFACLSRDVTIVLFHDTTFRPPAGPIVEKKDGSIFFPPVPFPEVKQKNVVSASPGAAVDRYIRNYLYQRTLLKDEASLLIGYDKASPNI